MPFTWEVGTEYRAGEEITFENHRYRATQDHFSAPHLRPSPSSHLWEPLGAPASFDSITTPSPPLAMPSPDSSRSLFHRNHPTGEENYEHKDHKVLAAELFGAAAVVGGGIWAYEHHKNKKNEEKKQQLWQSEMANSPDKYYENVNQRTEAINAGYHENYHVGPINWVGAIAGEIPPNAIPVGQESSGEPLYIARAFYEGGVHPGKIGRNFSGAHIGYGGEEVVLGRYEVLCGSTERIKWIDVDGRLQVQGWQPVEGGREANGRFLFVALCAHDDGVHPGKILDHDDHATIGYGGKEIWCRRFSVASYA